jgi:hypothetical protein
MNAFPDVEQFKLVIIQESVKTKPSTWDVSQAKVREFEVELLTVLEDIRNGDVALNPGKHCQYCKAISSCPEVRNYCTSIAVHELSDDLGVLLDMADDLKTFIAAVERKARTILEDGGSVNGWTLEPTKARKAWKDEQEAINFLLKEVGDGGVVIKPLGFTALKKLKVEIPEDMIEAKLSGETKLVRSYST